MVNDRTVKKKKQLKEQLMFYNNHERNIFTLFFQYFVISKNIIWLGISYIDLFQKIIFMVIYVYLCVFYGF